METDKILSADLLDILFEGKNKDYGAYELRKTDSARTATALGLTALVLLILLCSFISNEDKKTLKPFVVDIHDPTNIPDEPKLIPKKIIVPPTIKTKTVAFTPPKIVSDKLVLDLPVENKDMEDAKVGLKTTAGNIDDGIPTPAVEVKGSNVIEAPRSAAKEVDVIFEKVEIEATFKGDWVNYVRKEIEKHIDELSDAGQSGTCLVKFIVSKEGIVSNVEATTMIGTKLAEIAVNAIRKGPKWVPAIQNGQSVSAYRMQPISFQLQEQ